MVNAGCFQYCRTNFTSEGDWEGCVKKNVDLMGGLAVRCNGKSSGGAGGNGTVPYTGEARMNVGGGVVGTAVVMLLLGAFIL